MDAPAKRSSKEAKRGSKERRLKEASPLPERAESGGISSSSVADSEATCVDKLARCTCGLSGICDPRAARRSEIAEWTAAKTGTPGGSVCSPKANPMASAAIPAGIERSPARTKPSRSRANAFIACRRAAGTPRPPISRPHETQRLRQRIVRG